jgi:hypothetical protein
MGLDSGQVPVSHRSVNTPFWTRRGIPAVFWLRLYGFAECAAAPTRSPECEQGSDDRENQMGDWTRRLRPSVNLTERSTDGFKRKRLSVGPTLDGATKYEKEDARFKKAVRGRFVY